MINLNSVDWNSIVNQLIKQQHKSRVEPLQIQQNLSNTVKQSLEELRSKFIGIASSLESFKTANGGFLAKTASSSSSSVVTATVNGFAQVGTYNITVTSLATTGHSTSAAYSSKNTPIFNGLNDTLPASERTISVTIGSGSNAQTFNFVVTSSTTLESLANQINSTIPTDKAVAQIINTGTSDNPAYRLRIQAVQTGVDKGSVAVNYSGSQTQIQDFVSSMTYQSATDAVFTVDGINFTKDKNSVEISSGLTINLKAVGTSQIQVSIDTEATIQKVQNFVKAYNDAIEYINQKNANDPSKNTAQPLRLTQADERTLEQIRNKIFSYSVNENGNIWKLSAFGIKTEKSGKLVIDVNELKKAIEQNPDKIAALAHQIGDGAGNPTTGISAFYNPTSSAFQSAINNFGDQSRQLGEKIEKELMALNQEQLRLQNQFSRLNRLQQQLAQALSSLQSFQTSPF